MLTSEYDPRTKLVRYIERELAESGQQGVFLAHGFTSAANEPYNIILHRHPESRCIDTLTNLPANGIVMHIQYNPTTRLARILENGRSMVVKPQDFGQIYGDIREALATRAPNAA